MTRQIRINRSSTRDREPSARTARRNDGRRPSSHHKRRPSSRRDIQKFEAAEMNLNDSMATTLPAISTRRDALNSTSAMVDFDGNLMNSTRAKTTKHGDVTISVKAKRPKSAGGSNRKKHAVKLVSCRHFGLLVSTLFAGVFSSCIKRGMLPLLQAELELESYQVDAAAVLVMLPWSYSFVLGFVSDAMPLLGSRRKAYIIAGWVTSLLACFAIAVLNYTLEYNALSSQEAAKTVLEHRLALINAYIGLIMLASFGGILPIVIAQTYVVAQARREPLGRRGQAIGTLLMTQFIGECAGQIAADRIIFNITQFGVTPLVSFRETALFFMFYALLPLAMTVFMFDEDSDPPAIDDYEEDESSVRKKSKRPSGSCFTRARKAFRLNWRRLQTALGMESTTRIIRFFMIFVFLSEFSLTYPHARLAEWCNMSIKAQSSGDITMEAFYVLAVAAWKFCAINCNWRWCMSASLVIFVMAPQIVYFFMATLQPSTRSTEAFMFMTALRGFLRGALVVLEVAVAAEIAPVGGEGAFVGVIVSMSSIMRLLSTSFSNALGYVFEEGVTSVEQEPSQVALAFGICYSIRLVSIVALLFLPRQKQELQQLHRFGAKGNKGTTWWVLGSLGCAFVVSAAFNLLAIMPSTSCLRIVGGSGCS